MHGVFDKYFHPGAVSVAPLGEVRGEDHGVRTIHLLYATNTGPSRRPAVRTPTEVVADSHPVPPRMPQDDPMHRCSAAEATAQSWAISGTPLRRGPTYRDRQKEQGRQSYKQQRPGRQGGFGEDPYPRGGQ